MKIALLKAVARSLMRTANRRLKEWVNSDIKNSNFSEIYEKIRYSNFYNSETNKFTMRNLSERDLSDLVEVQRSLRDIDTPKKYIKKVKKIYKEIGIKSKDVNLLNRAIERFKAVHGVRYNAWLDFVVEKKDIKSNGDTLSQWLKDIVNEQIGKEYTQSEIENITKQDGFEKF